MKIIYKFYKHFNSGNRDTKLTAWFKLNILDPDARDIKYLDIAKYYVWKSEPRKWIRRKRKISDTISRMHMIHPNELERYCLRLLLLHVPGATCFEDIRKVEGIQFSTFHEAAVERKLMQDDKEWHNCLAELELICTDIDLIRNTFVMILCYSEPSSPAKLWFDHRIHLCQDILFKERIRMKNQSLEYSEAIFNAGLYRIDQILQKNGKLLSNFSNMPQIPKGLNKNFKIIDRKS